MFWERRKNDMNVTFKMYLPLSRNITSLAFNYFVHGNNVKNVCSDNNISYEIWEHHEMMSASLVDAALMIRRKSDFFLSIHCSDSFKLLSL